MSRDPAEITQESAVHVAKHRLMEMINDPSLGWLQKMALKSAIAPGGGVEQIGEVLYASGLRLTIDRNNTEHQQWLRDGSVELADDA